MIPPVGFEPTKHLQAILSRPPLTGLGNSGIIAVNIKTEPALTSCILGGNPRQDSNLRSTMAEDFES